MTRTVTHRISWTLFVLLALAPAVLAAAAASDVAGDEAAQAGAPPLRPIPGLTAADPFPNACVDCHLNFPERNLDERLSTILGGLRDAGKHPDMTDSLGSIPGACLTCHGSPGSAEVPSLAELMHVRHPAGGEQNQYVVEFQGKCTYCHKRDAATGVWSVPSAETLRGDAADAPGRLGRPQVSTCCRSPRPSVGQT